MEIIFMALKKDTTDTLTIRVDKGLKSRLKKKYGRKLSSVLIPFLEKKCG